uniref:Uncharacterized protein n=1 Tax=Quercus lobata TaxID=97700 RepID=A0A7N2LBQ4_QUELO
MNLRSFTYEDLEEATGGFKKELGKRSFGTVYKGVLASSHNKYVAVKKLDNMVKEGKVERLVENDEEALSDLKWVKKLVMVAMSCIQDVPSSRPSMKEVTHMLEGIFEISTFYPFLYSSTFEPDFWLSYVCPG